MFQTGAEGGTPIFKMTPDDVEELALAFLGVEKVFGEYLSN